MTLLRQEQVHDRDSQLRQGTYTHRACALLVPSPIPHSPSTPRPDLAAATPRLLDPDTLQPLPPAPTGSQHTTANAKEPMAPPGLFFASDPPPPPPAPKSWYWSVLPAAGACRLDSLLRLSPLVACSRLPTLAGFLTGAPIRSVRCRFATSHRRPHRCPHRCRHCRLC